MILAAGRSFFISRPFAWLTRPDVDEIRPALSCEPALFLPKLKASKTTKKTTIIIEIITIIFLFTPHLPSYSYNCIVEWPASSVLKILNAYEVRPFLSRQQGNGHAQQNSHNHFHRSMAYKLAQLTFIELAPPIDILGDFIQDARLPTACAPHYLGVK